MIGGRSELMEVTIEEAFGLMCMVKDKREFEQDEKEFERYIRYRSLQLSRPTDEKDTEGKRAREAFEKQIMPRKMKQRNGLPSRPAKREYKWDFEKKEE
ncbi:hypothetical protein P4639_14575 [Priestia megaterium]|uniref:hypothetical protein n=1 Tax=Priestia megaterium TaxID=1404 RepID=UPI002E221CBB|nr:hypothetical protein [Priestia megaterium]